MIRRDKVVEGEHWSVSTSIFVVGWYVELMPAKG